MQRAGAVERGDAEAVARPALDHERRTSGQAEARTTIYPQVGDVVVGELATGTTREAQETARDLEHPRARRASVLAPYDGIRHSLMVDTAHPIRIGGNPQCAAFRLGCRGGPEARRCKGQRRFEMFKTIVWATDGSESADRALELAAELAATPGAKLFAVHAVEHFAGGRSSGYPVRVDEDDLKASIRRQIESIREDGVDASF